MATRAPVEKKKAANGKGSVYFHTATHRYVAKATIETPEGKVRRTWYGKTAQEAEDKMNDARALARKGDFSFKVAPTVESWCRRWLDTVTIRVTSKEKYRQAIENHVIPALGKIRLNALAPSAINKFQADLKAKGLSPATINRIKTALGQALNAAVQDGLIMRNVVRQSRPVAREYEEQAVLTPAQQTELFQAEANNPDLPLWKLLSQTGMRIGEAQGLTWHHIDFQAGTIKIESELIRHNGEWLTQRPKTMRSRRTLKMNAQARQVLRTLYTVKPDDDYVFKPVPPSTLSHHLRDALEAAGLPAASFHIFRHSYASILLDAGVPLPEVSSILGHSNTSITAQVYAHWLNKTSNRASEVMDKLFAEDL